MNQVKKAIKNLEKEFHKSPVEQQEIAEFFTDIKSEESYVWTFKIEGEIIRYSYLFETQEIVKSTIN